MNYPPFAQLFNNYVITRDLPGRPRTTKEERIAIKIWAGKAGVLYFDVSSNQSIHIFIILAKERATN